MDRWSSEDEKLISEKSNDMLRNRALQEIRQANSKKLLHLT